MCRRRRRRRLRGSLLQRWEREGRPVMAGRVVAEVADRAARAVHAVEIFERTSRRQHHRRHHHQRRVAGMPAARTATCGTTAKRPSAFQLWDDR